MSTETQPTKRSSRSNRSRTRSANVNPSSPAALIISKFNRRYRHNLEDILNFYGEVTTDSNVVEKIRMKEIDLEQFTIGFHMEIVEFEILKPIPYDDVDHKCKNWDDVETRLVKMCNEAAESRGYSAICLKKVIYPLNIWNILLIVCILLLFLGVYEPDLVYDTILGKIPYIEYLKPYNNAILIAAMITHLTESIVFMRPKLAYYRVPADYQMEWYVLSMLDGYQSVLRLQKYVDASKDRYFDFTDDSESIDAPVCDSDTEF